MLWTSWFQFLVWFSNPPLFFSKPVWTGPSAPTTLGISVTLIFLCFLSSLGRSMYFYIFSLSFIFLLGSAGRSKSIRLQVIFLLFIKSGSSRPAGIRWSVCILKSQKNSYVLFSWRDSGLNTCHLVICSDFNLLHNFQGINIHTFMSSHVLLWC